jgi:hypothetical protein
MPLGCAAATAVVVVGYCERVLMMMVVVAAVAVGILLLVLDPEASLPWLGSLSALGIPNASAKLPTSMAHAIHPTHSPSYITKRGEQSILQISADALQVRHVEKHARFLGTLSDEEARAMKLIFVFALLCTM